MKAEGGGPKGAILQLASLSHAVQSCLSPLAREHTTMPAHPTWAHASQTACSWAGTGKQQHIFKMTNNPDMDFEAVTDLESGGLFWRREWEGLEG